MAKVKAKTTAKSNATEKPVRLPPSVDTTRKLYLQSGNNCAFPGCHERMISEEGNFVGEICHIEDAKPGCRFNPDQSDDERRHFSNLLLLCHKHHVDTSNAKKYSVATMKKMKADHEAKFTDVASTILKSVTDITKLERPTRPSTLKRMARVLRWDRLTDEELLENVDDISKLIDRLSKVPRPVRELFSVAVTRAKNASSWGGTEIEFHPDELALAVNLERHEVHKYLGILDEHGFITDNDKDDNGLQLAGICDLPGTGWPFWAELRKFCEAEKLDLAQFIIAMDFKLLDEGA